MTVRPLDGIRVIDFAQVWAGPYCAMLLALAGAEVIRVETMGRAAASLFVPPQPGAATPGQPAPAPVALNPNSTRGFNTVNLNKRSVRLDLHNPAGLALAKDLVRKGDVVVENFRPGAMDRLGLGYKDLSQVKPDIIMVSISGMGQEGPERRYAAYAANFGALSGMGLLTSYPDGIPTEMRGVLDLFTGTTACFAVLTALHHRRRTGEGQYIDIAAREASSSVLGDIFTDYAMNGRIPQPVGNRHPFHAPYGVYPCQEDDSWISIAVGSDAEFCALCKVMGKPELADDPRYVDEFNRWNHQDELDELIGEWTRPFKDTELMRKLQAAGVAAMPSFSNKEFSEDEHLKARGVYTSVEHPELGRQVMVGPPFRLAGTPLRVDGPAPLLGQHSQEVFCGLLGMSEAEVERLTNERVIY